VVCRLYEKYVLSQGVELPHVVEYNVVPMLKVQELLQLTAEQTRRQVMCTKGSTEFTPWDMVIIRQGGDVGSPPCSSCASELLRSVHSLLILCAVK
jgi:hypothetical protein